VIREHAVVGHVPDEPLLEATDAVITVGSCFARELRHSLREAGFLSSKIFIPEGLNNTYAMLDFLSWCVTGEATGRGFRYDRLESGEIGEWMPHEKQEAYAASIADAGAFVFTIGLAEVWQDLETGGVFWHGVPEAIFDPDRHVFRLTTVDENVDNIRRIVELVRQVNADAPIVLTLSPVPLKGTFRELACMSADCVSKSVLRVALDQVLADSPSGVYYWPSFEIVRWAGAHLPWPAYGLNDNKARHVSRRLVGEIIDAFVESFYTREAVAAMQTRAGSSSSE
jgi:GSCFA family protein